MTKRNEVFTCPICDYQFSKAEEMREHMRTCMKEYDYEQKKFKCEKCPYRCQRERDLQKHILSKHEGDQIENLTVTTPVLPLKRTVNQELDFDVPRKKPKTVDGVAVDQLSETGTTQSAPSTSQAAMKRPGSKKKSIKGKNKCDELCVCKVTDLKEDEMIRFREVTTEYEDDGKHVTEVSRCWWKERINWGQ